ncbi:MAG: M43 family zinc metalloprotease [Myxococcota bacterium]
MSVYLRSLLLVAVSVAVACGDEDATDGGNRPTGGSGEGGAGHAQGGGAPGGSGGGGPTFSEPVVVDLPALPAGGAVDFTIPSGALGFHLVARGESVGLWGIERVSGPEGGAVFDNFAPAGSLVGTGYGYLGVATTAVPLNDQPTTNPPMAGSWSANLVGNIFSATVSVQRTDDGLFHGGVLDLRIHIADGLVIQDPDPAHAITAAEAPTDASVAARVDAFYRALDEHFGIGRGEVTFYAIGAEYLNVVGESAFGELIESTAGTPGGQALHMVWSQYIEPQAGVPVWGVSPGLPGNVLETGTPASAIALAVQDTFDANADALTLLHETGHFLGLNHTTELNGIQADPVADTPECADIGPTAFLQCPDRTNIMFPVYYAATGGIGITVSPTQVEVVRGAPVYRAFANAEVATPRQGSSRMRAVTPPRNSDRIPLSGVVGPRGISHGLTSCAHSIPGWSRINRGRGRRPPE